MICALHASLEQYDLLVKENVQQYVPLRSFFVFPLFVSMMNGKDDILISKFYYQESKSSLI